MLDEFRSTLITWDKATSRIYSPVTANASDENGRKLVVQIVNSGQVEDLTGASLHLYWETRDKLHDGLDVFKAVDLKKGEFELSYTTGMLSNKGVLNANLVLIDTVGRVVSERFKITVTEGIDDDAIQSENSFSSLTQALIDVGPRLNSLTAQLQQTEQELSSQLAQTKQEVERKRELEDLSETVLSAIEGGEGTSFDLLSIPQDSSVTFEKLQNGLSGLIRMGRNLLDVNDSNFTYDKRLSSAGTLGDTVGTNTSGYIKADAEDVIVLSRYGVTESMSSIVAYDSSKNLLNYRGFGTAYTTPADTAFIRVSSPLLGSDGVQVEKGSATNYEPFGYVIKANEYTLSNGYKITDLIEDKEGEAPINMASNGDFSDGTNGWEVVQSSNSIVDGNLINTGGGEGNRPGVLKPLTITSGHKYYFKTRLRITNSDCLFIYINTNNEVVTDRIEAPVSNEWVDKSYVYSPKSNDTGIRIRHYYADAPAALGKKLEVDYFIAIDLTDYFGAGNEPTADVVNSILNSFPQSSLGSELEYKTWQKSLDAYQLDKLTTIPTVYEEHVPFIHSETYQDDVSVSYLRDLKSNTSYQLTRINKNTFDGGEILATVRLTGADINDPNPINVTSYMQNNNHLLAINAGIFNTDTLIADGIVISNGAVLQSVDSTTHQGQYTLGIKSDGTLVYYDSTVTATEILADGSTNAVVGFVPIISNSTKMDDSVIAVCPHAYEKHPRQVIGQMSNGDYIIMSCAGRLQNEDGMTLDDCARILLENNVTFAYNLDGGGSKSTVINKRRVDDPVENRRVPTIITFDYNG